MLAGACDVRALDLPGHGLRRAEPFDLERAIDELVRETIVASSSRRVYLAGDSLGGYLGLAVAARTGAAVSGVIAGSCTYPMRGAWASLARASLAAGVVTATWPFVALTRLATTRDVGDAIVARGFAPAMRGVTLRALLGRDVLADVRAIAAPVVFVDGAFDFPIALFARVFARVVRAVLAGA